MKRKFLVFRDKSGTEDGGPLPQTENEVGGAGNAEKSGANEQADASRRPDHIAEGHRAKNAKATQVPDHIQQQTGRKQ